MSEQDPSNELFKQSFKGDFGITPREEMEMQLTAENTNYLEDSELSQDAIETAASKAAKDLTNFLYDGRPIPWHEESETDKEQTE